MTLDFQMSTFEGSSPRLASVTELESAPYRAFMSTCNAFAREHGLREFINWSKIWEYPWLYHRGLSRTDWRGRKLVDFGSEISPLPWMLALRGARVTLVEADPQWVPIWENLRDKLGVDVTWHIVKSELVPLPDECADAVTSFSVIEHQPNKALAVAEIARILKRGAPFYLSFDICEPAMGMTCPEWIGRALTMAEFEREIWRHPAFGNAPTSLTWNLADIPDYQAWHLRSSPYLNYVTAAAVMVKR